MVPDDEDVVYARVALLCSLLLQELEPLDIGVADVRIRKDIAADHGH
jgi:hypothetical protein